jgi:hypothetical protein
MKLLLTSKIFDVVGMWTSKGQGENIIEYNIMILDILKCLGFAIFCQKPALQHPDSQNKGICFNNKIQMFRH